MIDFNHPKLQALFETAFTYQKKERTGLRKPSMYEVGTELVAYVKDNTGGVRVESVNIITPDVVIARNPENISITDTPLYNEWPIRLEVATQNYGFEEIMNLSDSEFTYLPKKETLKAIELTYALLKELDIPANQLANKAFEIKIESSERTMWVSVGDYLTHKRYSISAHDMRAYEIVDIKNI